MQLPHFTTYWQQAQYSIFRLETLPEFKVPGDIELFEKWKKGNVEFHEQDSWQQQLLTTKSRGVQMQRVRITPLPIPAYIQFEIAYWQLSKKNGEEFFFLTEQEYQNILSSLDFIPKDFWLFDDAFLDIFDYKEGNLKQEIPISDTKMIENHVSLKQLLLQKALPMDDFLKNI